MKGNAQVLKRLNLALKGELTAINQYFLHARMFDDWGVTKLGKHEYDESIEEMRHADVLIQRILLLEGLPNLQDLGKLYIGENVVEALKGDLKLEQEGIQNYRDGIKDCEAAHDYVTRDLFIKLLTDEEGHEDFLNTQLKLIETIGIERYVQLNSGSAPEQDGA
ncbi:MAG TPA: bacterioferritin [Micavibrio sp.]|nr:bacterioferritin [Micavibrio sp.]